MNIHILYTGGTIGADAGAQGAARLSVPDGISFSESRPFNILSENMTAARWYELILHLRALATDGKDGLIITHGTDTLAYTACLLSLVFSAPKLPVLLVSANRPLADPASNGRENFAAALAVIEEKIPPGVYAVYKNSDRRCYLHAGAELLQCPCGGNDLFSVRYGGAAGDPLAEIRAGKLLCRKAPPPAIPHLGAFFENFDGRFRKVPAIRPYVGIDYDDYRLEGADAVLHGLYHASTAAAFTEGGDFRASVLYLAKRCEEADIPLYVAPFPQELLRGGRTLYETTGAVSKRLRKSQRDDPRFKE